MKMQVRFGILIAFSDIKNTPRSLNFCISNSLVIHTKKKILKTLAYTSSNT